MLKLFKRKPRVLLLDDDVSMQKLVAILLRRDGLRVDVVNRGKDAVTAIAKESYDVILLDLMMPHEGGMTVIAHLRDTAPDVLQKVIVLTATPKAVLKGIASEVAGVVRKPFKPEELVSTVRGIISRD